MGVVGDGEGTLVNDGTLAALGSMSVLDIAAAEFVNDGTLLIGSGATMAIFGNFDAPFTVANLGLVVNAGGVLALSRRRQHRQHHSSRRRSRCPTIFRRGVSLVNDGTLFIGAGATLDLLESARPVVARPGRGIRHAGAVGQ